MGKKRIKLITASEEEKKPAKIRSGKADEARLADMGQKALSDLEKIKAKEEELEKLALKKAVIKETKIQVKKVRSKRYLSLKQKFDKNKLFEPAEALTLISQNANAGFDESVEIHLNLKDKLQGSVSLPYGSGKKQKVAIASEELIKQIEAGKIDFDILISPPNLMPKLAKVAKILGPKGLMPNPKNGTITNEPEVLKKKLESGVIHFKTESKAPILHFILGKVSFGQEKLLANLKALIEAVKKSNIKKASLCSTMGPSLKLDFKTL